MDSAMFDWRPNIMEDMKGVIMNYEELTMVNEELSSVKISGKPYVQVNDRVQGFRKLFPMGNIYTELVTYIQTDYCVFKCDIYDDEGEHLATGYAQETVEKNRNINRTSMLENCETSAVGRALGFLGIGSVDSIASADEVNKAINKGRELDSVIGEDIAADLVQDLVNAGQSPDVVVKFNKVPDLSQLTFEQYNNVVKRYLKK